MMLGRRVGSLPRVVDVAACTAAMPAAGAAAAKADLKRKSRRVEPLACGDEPAGVFIEPEANVSLCIISVTPELQNQ